ncbi:DUF4328 domain-containing protein [Vannielia sp.]|uniref:DUF4328 domain-containing protein n=1 Tax=Vannielia sp. TaxID=2813045 RepID=UPI00261E1B51|nr:DUF4328 domain-containing protein [Vannielia sp.]MDF1872077.1 DUF4328 domain-containing protein [Vannielia sp.]
MTSHTKTPSTRILPLAVGFTVAYLIVDLALSALDVAESFMLSGLPPDMLYEDALSDGLLALYGVLAIAAMVFFAVFVTCIVINAIFLYRAGELAKLLSTNEARSGGHAHWLWFIVPIANLFMPFKKMRQLITFATEGDETLKAPAPGYLKTLWACWIIGNLVANLGFRSFMGAETVADVTFSNWSSPFASAFTVVSGLLFIRYMREVSAGLDAQASRTARRGTAF